MGTHAIIIIGLTIRPKTLLPTCDLYTPRGIDCYEYAMYVTCLLIALWRERTKHEIGQVVTEPFTTSITNSLTHSQEDDSVAVLTRTVMAQQELILLLQRKLQALEVRKGS